jgi:hypothetical protein
MGFRVCVRTVLSIRGTAGQDLRPGGTPENSPALSAPGKVEHWARPGGTPESSHAPSLAPVVAYRGDRRFSAAS